MPRGPDVTTPKSKTEGVPQAYAASWINRLTGRVDRLAGPSWPYYAGLGLVLLLVQASVLWLEGPAPPGTFLTVHMFLAGMISFFLALLPYLDSMAEVALATLRPALTTDGDEYERLRYELTTLPSSPTLLASLAAIIFLNLLTALFGAPAHFQTLASTSPISAAVLYSVYMAAWWVWGALLYHTIHQLRQIDRIYTEHARINLFQMSPLYAFSGLSAVTAVVLAFTTYGWIAINPETLDGPIGWAIVLAVTVLALAAFIWPVLGIHRLLAQEKGRLLDESSLRLEAALVELHRRMDSENLEGMADLNYAIASLELEHKALSRVPTWPWQPETVRLLLTALLLPLALLIGQVVIQRFLGQ